MRSALLMPKRSATEHLAPFVGQTNHRLLPPASGTGFDELDEPELPSSPHRLLYARELSRLAAAPQLVRQPVVGRVHLLLFELLECEQYPQHLLRVPVDAVEGHAAGLSDDVVGKGGVSLLSF